MNELQELLERVKDATGPDRDLDVDVAWTIEPKRYGAAYWNGRTGNPGTTLPRKLDGMGRVSVRSNCPSFTASIDAALDLVERALPGEGIVLETHGKCVAGIGQSGKFPAQAPTAPLAILTALLQSLIGQEQK